MYLPNIQSFPLHPGGQLQTYVPWTSIIHSPPFIQGSLLHQSSVKWMNHISQKDENQLRYDFIEIQYWGSDTLNNY